jgi:FMN-dependent NADH-azoreductase
MTSILHIKSSSNLKGSVTRQIGPVLVERLKNQYPGATVKERDLVAQPVPHIGSEFVEALIAGDESRLSLSNQLIEEVFASDILVIEAPMYNFSIPSVLKAWIDHVVRARKTFQYTPTGPEGKLKDKKAFLVLGSAGIYSEGPTKVMDYQETYLRMILGFVGITEVETIRIEGIAMGPEKAAAALEKARSKAQGLIKLEPYLSSQQS